MASLLTANLPSEDEEDDDFDLATEADKGEREDRADLGFKSKPKRGSKRG